MRLRYWNPRVEKEGDYGTYWGESFSDDPRQDYVPVYTSEYFAGAWHIPVLDIDFECGLVPSKTPGHHHLAINRPMSWKSYKKLLKALVKAGIVEKSWYQVAKRRRFTMVRA